MSELKRICLSVYDEDLQQLIDFGEKHNINDLAKIIRYITRNYIKNYDNEFKNDIYLYFSIPIIIGVIASIFTIWSQRVINQLKAILVVNNDLINLNIFSVILGSLAIGLILANIIWLYKKKNKI